ncbi:MAG: phosphatase PAP2 family protein [Candidatus Falkowbacteria bacterium]
MKISDKLNQSTWFKLLLFIPLCYLLYLLMMQYIAICELGGRLTEAVSLKTFIDAWTPVNIYIVWPYVACLFYVPLSGILYAFNRRISAVQVISFYVSVILIFLVTYAIYLVFPTTASEVMLTSFDPNSNVFVSEGMFRDLQDFYISSTPLGDFPSIHVAPLVLMGLFLYKRWRSLFWMFLPFASIGAIGTFVLKFHTVVGFLGGLAMGCMGYYVLYKKVALRLTSKYLRPEERM